MNQFRLLTICIFGAVAVPAMADQKQFQNACSVASPPANCQGLQATSVWFEVPPGAYSYIDDPECMNDQGNATAKLLETAVASVNPKLAQYAGGVAELVTKPIDDAFRNAGGDIAKAFSPYKAQSSSCATVTVVVPVEAKVVGYRMEMTDNWENWTWRRCEVGKNCGEGWCLFATVPETHKNNGIQFVSTLFKNWSHNRPRVAKLTVFYQYNGIVLSSM